MQYQGITLKTMFCFHLQVLRWFETVSSTYTLMGCYNHSLSLDATVMVSKNCPASGEQVGIIFVTQ